MLNSHEVTQYSRLPEYDISSAAAQVVDGQTQFCCGAFSGKQLVAYAFFARDYIDPAFNTAGSGFGGVGFRMPDNTVYMYKLFVLPEFRGSSQMVVVVQQAMFELLPNGGWVITSTDIDNRAAQGLFRKLGFVQYPKIVEHRLLGAGFYKIPDRVQLGSAADEESLSIELIKGPRRV